MKLRTEFVSNSSTTCFVIRFDGKNITREKVVAKLNELRDFYLKNMTKDSIVAKKLEESRHGWPLDEWPVIVIDPESAMKEAKEAYDKARENAKDGERTFPMVDYDWTVASSGLDKKEYKDSIIVEVPINYDHIADYLRTFLVNLFDAEDMDEIF